MDASEIGFVAMPFQVHVADIKFRSEHQPFPLEVVTELQSAIEPGLVVSEHATSRKIMGSAMAELPAAMNAKVKPSPIAHFWRRRLGCDLLHVFAVADRVSPGHANRKLCRHYAVNDGDPNCLLHCVGRVKRRESIKSNRNGPTTALEFV